MELQRAVWGRGNRKTVLFGYSVSRCLVTESLEHLVNLVYFASNKNIGQVLALQNSYEWNANIAAMVVTSNFMHLPHTSTFGHASLLLCMNTTAVVQDTM